MIKKAAAFAALSAMILMCGCLGGEDENGGSSDKEGALDFSLKVVGTYFDNDNEAFFSYLADEIYSLEEGESYAKSEVEEMLAEEEFIAGEEFVEYSMEEYLNTYDPRVMDHEEAQYEFPEEVSALKDSGWEFDEDDYIFIGYETKSGEEGPLWDDMLVFGVTHESGEGKLKALG